MKPKGKVLIIHGGGLAEPSKHVLMRIAKNVSKVYDEVFIGKYSFESLYNQEFICKYDDNLIKLVKGKRGTYFGTCRGIDLCDPNLFQKAIECMHENGISTIIVAGGDGSSRQVAETNDAFLKEGINTIFPIPITIDGINGGLSIGINEAVRESIRQIENIASTALRTRDNEKFGVCIVELQGRNRDDIMANVLHDFNTKRAVADFGLSSILLRAVPATLEINEEKLITEINESSKKTLILISEGSKIKMPELVAKINRKVRTLVVGHPSQSNNMMRPCDAEIYDKWVDKACNIIAKDPYNSYCIRNNGKRISRRPIDYYAKLNPRNGQKAELPNYLKSLIEYYMSNDTE